MFEHGKSYPIDTLPDDLYADKPAGDLWAIRDALFWNDCQGWWIESIAEYNRHNGVARFWQPLPADPMTREEILKERGMFACVHCDRAVTIGQPHSCQSGANASSEQKA